VVLGVVAIATTPREARACGGCFVRPEVNTVVTDHRMAFVISQGQTTLYDQIKYNGAPESFAWVLPISGDATVGLSADVMFATLDAATQSQVIPPPTNCYRPPQCPQPPQAGSVNDSAGGGVTVTKHEVVGPYDTVQLKATDPNALTAWLTSNGYGVPADVQGVVAQYVAEKSDFLAMKLVPGATVQSMRPVRVTTKGASPVLPLRMVAAGTGPTVGITLWMIAEGRYEPQNFATFRISDAELAWDWASSRSNFAELRAQKTKESAGRAWELESSVSVSVDGVKQQIKNGGYGIYGNFGGAPIDPNVPDYSGTQTMTADEVRDADLATLFSGINGSSARVTRLRADLAHAALDKDLRLQAASDQGIVSNVHSVTKEIGQPQCPIYDGCSGTGRTAPRDQAKAASQPASFGGGGCDVADKRSDGALVTVGALFGLVAVVRRRRKR
jgi:hypothetical protein